MLTLDKTTVQIIEDLTARVADEMNKGLDGDGDPIRQRNAEHDLSVYIMGVCGYSWAPDKERYIKK